MGINEHKWAKTPKIFEPKFLCRNTWFHWVVAFSRIAHTSNMGKSSTKCAVFHRHPYFCQLERQPNSTTTRIPHLHCMLIARVPAVVCFNSTYWNYVLTFTAINVYIYIKNYIYIYIYKYDIIDISILWHLHSDGRWSNCDQASSKA